MRHRWMTKGMSARVLAGVFQKSFNQNGIQTLGSGDGWLLGASGPALVLCQAMPLNDRECHVMTVAAAPDQPAVGVCDTVATFIEREVLIDHG